MRVLVVGAGAVGGYFGGRMLENGVDVTFLVREKRREQLQRHGLQLESIHGNVVLQPKTILAGEEAGTFDLILLSTKAYHLKTAMNDFRPYVTEGTVILPLLNGILHFGELAEAFGEEKVIGGLCFIESTLDEDGKILQTSSFHELVFGERSGERTERILKIAEAFQGAVGDFRLSDHINQELWQKYLFIATMSGITTLMRSPIGPIRENPSGRETLQRLLKEIIAVMRSVDAPLDGEIENLQLAKIEGLGFGMKSSMQRDMEKGVLVEADHLHGFLLEIAEKERIALPIVEAVYGNLKIYEQSRV